MAREPSASLLTRVSRIAWAEVGSLMSRNALAQASSLLPSSAFAITRTALLRAAGVTIGPDSLVQGRIRLTGIGNPCQWLTIGRETLITGGLHADLGAPVHIGDAVRIGHDVSLLTINHALGATWFRAGPSTCAGIVIENGCWLASRCTILAGVVVGRGCIVAAGAVVTRSVPPNTLVAGIPARVIRELPLEGPDYEVQRAQSH